MTWQLGIDFGTTYTTAAIADPNRGVRMLELGSSSSKVPSCVLYQNEGFIVGEAARRQGALFPESFEATPKRRFRKDASVQLGGEQVAPTAMVSAVLDHVMKTATTEQPVSELSHIVLTHPALWGNGSKEQLVSALRDTGRCDDVEVTLYDEPVAAAHHYVRTESVPGTFAAVFDLGGGTFDTAVLKREDSSFSLHSRPGGNENLGGEDFDDQFFQHVLSVLREDDPDAADRLATSSDREWAEARNQLRQSVKASKEALSNSVQDHFRIGLPVGRDFQVTRDELMSCIKDEIDASVDNFAATVHAAEEKEGKQVDSIFLVGGSSRIPAIYSAVQQEFGDVILTKDNPKNVVALGAALHGAELAEGTPVGPGSQDPSQDPPLVDPPVDPPKPAADLELASLGQRFGGSLLDGLLGLLTLYIGWLVWSIVGTWPKGQSPGKGMLKMYVIDVKTGELATTGKMAARYGVDLAFAAVSLVTFLIPLLINTVTIFGQKRQRITDMIVGTRVVYDATDSLRRS